MYGAQVVGLDQPRPLERRPPLCVVPVHTFHYSATTPGRWKKAGKTRPDESLAVEHKVTGSIPERVVRFSSLQSRDNDCLQYVYSDAFCVCDLIVCKWQLILIV